MAEVTPKDTGKPEVQIDMYEAAIKSMIESMNDVEVGKAPDGKWVIATEYTTDLVEKRPISSLTIAEFKEIMGG